jgi:hypothetical protein
MDEYEAVDATIVDAELVEEDNPYDIGYETGLRDMKLAIMDALDDGSECSLWALDVIGSL